MNAIFIFELIISLINNSILLVKILNGKLSFRRIVVFFSIISFPLIILIIIKQYIIVSLIVTYVFPIYTIKEMKKAIILYITTLYQAIVLSITSSVLLLVNIFCEYDSIKYIIDIFLNLNILIILIFISKKKTKTAIQNFLRFTNKGIKLLIIITLYTSGILSIILSYIPEMTSFNIWYRILSFLFISIIIILCLIYPICISNMSLP